MVKGKFYLNAACDIPEEKVMEISDMIGVDLGIKQLATTSEEKYYTGEKIERNRQRYAGRRAALQKVGTKSAKRRLKKLSGKERKFKKDTNHRISKEIVADAKRTHCGIAMEDLKGIRKGKGKKVRKKQRATFSGWSFYELRQFITCKAQAAGVPVVFVNPRYTSQCCSNCWHIEKANRKSPSEFECRKCGYTAHADFNAAVIIQILGLCGWSYGGEDEFTRLQPQATALQAVS
jgi:IS605 OrfB family transposase